MHRRRRTKLPDVRKTQAELSFRLRREGDDAFLMKLGRSAFARWSRDPARSIRMIISNRRAQVVIAERADVPIGFAVIDPVPLGRAFGPWKEPRVARLDAIAVDGKAQRRGVGRALIAETENLARRSGAVVMSLMTASENRAARTLFRSAEYLPLVALPDSYADGDAAIEMFKLLDPSA